MRNKNCRGKTFFTKNSSRPLSCLPPLLNHSHDHSLYNPLRLSPHQPPPLPRRPCIPTYIHQKTLTLSEIHPPPTYTHIHTRTHSCTHTQIDPPPPHTHTYARARAHTNTHSHTLADVAESSYSSVLSPHSVRVFSLFIQKPALRHLSSRFSECTFSTATHSMFRMMWSVWLKD